MLVEQFKGIGIDLRGVQRLREAGNTFIPLTRHHVLLGHQMAIECINCDDRTHTWCLYWCTPCCVCDLHSFLAIIPYNDEVFLGFTFDLLMELPAATSLQSISVGYRHARQKMETLVGTEFGEQVMLDILLCTICCSLFSSTYCVDHSGAHHEESLIHLLRHKNLILTSLQNLVNFLRDWLQDILVTRTTLV